VPVVWHLSPTDIFHPIGARCVGRFQSFMKFHLLLSLVWLLRFEIN